MHPAINREVSNTRVADFHRQARRDAMSRAAAGALRSRKGTAQSPRGYRVAAQVRRFLALIAPEKRTPLIGAQAYGERRTLSRSGPRRLRQLQQGEQGHGRVPQQEHVALGGCADHRPSKPAGRSAAR